MLGNPDPDAQLMLLVKQGDISAFETLVEKYKQPITNYVARILQDRDEAEDIAQNVFIQVFKTARRYKATAKFSTWLFTIARNFCLNEIRRRSRRPADSLETTNQSQHTPAANTSTSLNPPEPSKKIFDDELIELIDEAIASLPETQKTALLLVREEELSYEDIAKILGCSLSATKSLIHRARESLKQKIKPYLNE
ncbi:MAG: sigma-70 family RNA polymerase sigma factor [Verrucomicrobia bacterium]|nr:sigma-70 family RNA polymerase sigma factor [Verrucomicrobiota bacterium]MCF7708896.1 sigma-70 family RNA polymerase sigma factor [Verrucomicrobiota bacterium]